MAIPIQTVLVLRAYMETSHDARAVWWACKTDDAECSMQHVSGACTMQTGQVQGYSSRHLRPPAALFLPTFPATPAAPDTVHGVIGPGDAAAR